MSDSVRKACIAGAPQSGKTHRLVAVYLESLLNRPYERRAFIVPNASHRDHLRTKIIELGNLEALPEEEILTLAEFLYKLAHRAGLLTGKRMTRMEDNLALLNALERVPAATALGLPRSLATAQHFLRSIEAMRHAGIFLSFMEGDRPQSVNDQVSELLLEAAHDYYGQMQSRFDGLAGQEQAVFALEHANPQILRALPQIILVDGFYDLHPLYQRAIAGLTTNAQLLLFSLPIVPGDETVRRLATFIDSLGLDTERISAGPTEPKELLPTIAEIKKGVPTETTAFTEPLAGGNIEIRALSTYLREAEFIADTVLTLHRRESVPLDEFLVVLNHPAAQFVSALEREFTGRKLPLIDLRQIQCPRLVAELLKAAFAYAAHPQPATLRTLMHAACPAFLEPTHETFAYLYRMGVFLEAGKASRFLRDNGQEGFARLLERLDLLRKELSPTGTFNTIRSYAEELGKETLARMTGDSVQVQLDKESLAAEEAALRGIVEALNVPSDRPRPPLELLPLASEACSLYAGRPPERRVGGVFVVDALIARQWQKQICFVPQCDSQRWPGTLEESTAGGDALRDHLARRSLRLRSPREAYEFEESLFLSAIVRATRRTFVTYSQREVSGRPQLPSPFLTPLTAALRKIEPQDTGAVLGTYADESALARACAEILRYGESEARDDRLDKAIAASALRALDASIIAERFHLAGIANEPPHTPLPAVTTLLPDSFSPNALTAYRKCPFYYFASKLLRLGDDLDSLEDGIGPMEVGKAVHETLTVAFEEYPEQVDAFALLNKALSHIAAARGYLHNFELELARDLAMWSYALSKFYLDECRMLQDTDTEVIAREKDLTAEFLDAEGYRFTLHGVVDRIDQRPDGTVLIYDYKSGRGVNFDAAQGEGVLVCRGIALAPFIYPLLVQQDLKAPGNPPPFSFILVRENERRLVRLQSVESDPRPPWEIVLASITRSIRSIQECDFRRAPHPAVVDCAECDLYRLCRRDIFTETLQNLAVEDIPDGLVVLQKERRI